MFWLLLLTMVDVQYKAKNITVRTHTTKSITLKAEDPPAEITSLQVLPNGDLLILDTGLVQQAFLFDSNGRLIRLIGQPGPGPGEYRMPGGLCLSGNRIHMISAGRRYILFDRDGEFLKQRKDTPPGGIGAKIYPGYDGTAYFTCYSREAKNTVFHVDGDGSVLNKFSSPDKEFGYYWAMLHPMGNLVVNSEAVLHMYIHRYQVNVFSLDGKFKRIFRLSSSKYVAPDFEKAKSITSKPGGLREFQYTHSIVSDFYELNGKYLTGLTSKTGSLLEFWDENFFGLGRFIVPKGEKLIGVSGENFVLFNPDSLVLKFIAIEF